MVVGPGGGVKAARTPGGTAQVSSAMRSSRRFTRCSEPRSGRATKSVSSPAIGARDLRPARPVQRGGDRMGGTRERAQDQQQARLVDLERQVGQQLAQAVLAGGLGLDEARRQRVGRGPLARDLDQPELGDVAADRGLGRAESTLAQRGGQLLLGADRPLVDQVADRPLAELLHDLHVRAAALARQPDDEDDRREHEPVPDEDVERARPQVAQHEMDRRQPRTAAPRPSRRAAERAATGDAGFAGQELASLEDDRRRP